MKRGAIWALLIALTAYQPISTDTYLPALPSMAESFGTSAAVMQWTLSAFLLGLASAQLFYGPLSDRFGRRPVLMVGISIYLLGTVACLYATTIDMLIVARFFQAVGCCAGPTLARAVVRDLYERDEAARALSILGAFMGLIPAVAPILGGYLLLAFDWRAIFLFMGVIGALTLFGLVAFFPETNKNKDPEALNPKRVAANYRSIGGEREFLGYGAAVSLTLAALIMFLSGSPFVLIEQLGVRADVYGYLFASMALSYSVGTIFSARLTIKLGIERMVMTGAAIGAVAAVAQATLAWSGVAGVVAIVIPQALFAASMGLTLPNGIAGAIGPHPTRAGAASSLIGIFQLTLSALASIGVAYLIGWTQVSMSTATAILAVSTCVLFYILVWRPHRGRHKAAKAAAEAAAAELRINELRANRPG